MLFYYYKYYLLNNILSSNRVIYVIKENIYKYISIKTPIKILLILLNILYIYNYKIFLF